MTKTYLIAVEVYDDTAMDEVENAIAEGLNNSNINCSFDISESAVSEEPLVVLDRRTNDNASTELGDFVSCCNCFSVW